MIIIWVYSEWKNYESEVSVVPHFHSNEGHCINMVTFFVFKLF